MAAEVVRAGCYFRMSTTDQDGSIDRQRSTVLPYCERKGYQVAAEFQDEGIAGDQFARRSGLRRLLAGAEAGEFDVIVCDEVSRLSRQKFTEFMAKVAYPLEQAGVTVDAVQEGPLGWEEVVDILKLTIYQTNASGESKKNSHRTLTGQAEVARRGRLLGGPRPHGYRAEYETVAEPGKPPKLVPVRLVPDGLKAEVIRWLFEQYAGGRVTLSDLVHELNARGAAPPARNNRKRDRDGNRIPADRLPPPVWTRQAVLDILRNPVYTGCLPWNRRRRGKYHRLTGGRVAKATRGQRDNDREDWVVTEGTHEPLVSRELFERVQDRLAGNRGGRLRAAARGYLLSGLLVCGHCGRTLRGQANGENLFYRCGAYDEVGRAVCGFGRVTQAGVVSMLLRVLQRTFLDPARLRELRAEVRRQEQVEQAPDRTAGLEAAAAALDRKVEQGRANLALLPADMIPGVVATVRGWEQERDQLRAELQRALAGGRVGDLEATIATAEAALWRLREAAAGCDQALLRDVLREMVERVEFRWERRPMAHRTRYTLTGGVIHLRPGGVEAVGAREFIECPGTSTSASTCGTSRSGSG
jgi:DNA invertase Pin-like site-specific DNA recombinase